MPEITFSGGPMHGQTVNVSKRESKFWFKGVLYYRKTGKMYVSESDIMEERKRADVTMRVHTYGKHSTVE